jgi:hypothetical protein
MNGYLGRVVEPSCSSGTGNKMFQGVLSKRNVIEDASRRSMLVTFCFNPYKLQKYWRPGLG